MGWLTMTINIINNIPVGIIKLNALNFSVDPDEEEFFYLTTPLYNFNCDIWYNFENNTIMVKMWGSIISMMQFRKRIMLLCPNLLV